MKLTLFRSSIDRSLFVAYVVLKFYGQVFFTFADLENGTRTKRGRVQPAYVDFGIKLVQIPLVIIVWCYIIHIKFTSQGHEENKIFTFISLSYAAFYAWLLYSCLLRNILHGNRLTKIFVYIKKLGKNTEGLQGPIDDATFSLCYVLFHFLCENVVQIYVISYFMPNLAENGCINVIIKFAFIIASGIVIVVPVQYFIFEEAITNMLERLTITVREATSEEAILRASKVFSNVFYISKICDQILSFQLSVHFGITYLAVITDTFVTIDNIINQRESTAGLCWLFLVLANIGTYIKSSMKQKACVSTHQLPLL